MDRVFEWSDFGSPLQFKAYLQRGATCLQIVRGYFSGHYFGVFCSIFSLSVFFLSRTQNWAKPRDLHPVELLSCSRLEIRAIVSTPFSIFFPLRKVPLWRFLVDLFWWWVDLEWATPFHRRFEDCVEGDLSDDPNRLSRSKVSFQKLIYCEDPNTKHSNSRNI